MHSTIGTLQWTPDMQFGIALQDTKDVGYNMQAVLERLQFVRRRKEEAEVVPSRELGDEYPEIHPKIRQKRYEAVDEKA